jgi:ribosome-associated toxin RatA of RatAB toxin-antitoxin module
MKSRLHIAAALFFLLSGVSPAVVAEPNLRVNADSDWGVVTIQADMLVPADAKTAWAVLTDYNNLARFVPEMESSRVISKPGQPLRIEQQGKSGILSFLVPEYIVLQIEEKPVEHIRFKAIAGSVSSMRGEWRIVGSGNPVRVIYTARIVPLLPLPPLLGTSMIENDVESKLSAVRREIARRAAAAKTY